MTRPWKALCLAMAMVALALFAMSCSSGGTSYRVINAIAYYPPYQTNGGFDLEMNGSLVFSNVMFTNINPPGKDAYQKVASGSDTLDVFAHGDTINGGLPIFSGAFTANGRTQYTLLLMGDSRTNPYAVQPFTDNNEVPATGDFALRVIDASNNLGKQQLDIYVVGAVSIVTGPNPPQPNATITYGQPSDYIVEPSGTWWLVVTQHGGHVPILSNSYTPGALQVRTVVLVDGPNGNGVGTPLFFSDLN